MLSPHLSLQVPDSCVKFTSRLARKCGKVFDSQVLNNDAICYTALLWLEMSSSCALKLEQCSRGFPGRARPSVLTKISSATFSISNFHFNKMPISIEPSQGIGKRQLVLWQRRLSKAKWKQCWATRNLMRTGCALELFDNVIAGSHILPFELKPFASSHRNRQKLSFHFELIPFASSNRSQK